jgi:hypothetical protein
MADRPMSEGARRRAYDDDLAEIRLAKVRAKIQRNKPDGRAALHWRKESATRIVSGCGRFCVEQSGTGEGARYTAKLLPHSVIGNRRFTWEQAKEDCNAHASPLPLEAPVKEREPGEDDE